MFRYRCILVRLVSESIVSILNSECDKVEECVVLDMQYIVKYFKVKWHDVGN